MKPGEKPMLQKGQPELGGGDEPFSILSDDGSVRSGARPPAVSDEQALALYRGMLQVRLVDDRMMKLQRQGRLGFYMQSMGEEATHFGGAFSIELRDWVFPSYREPGVFFWRGYTIPEYVNQLHGNAEDPIKGRQMPVHHSARWLNMVSISSPVGTQIPQAVGMAMAARMRKKDDVALVYFGEGATSTGQFHVGMNFAGVYKAPCIFFCRNNGWAISTPGNHQTASKSIAIKALAYGMPGVRVDGNDLLAVIAVMQDAVARARAGEGPTLIEAVTYRRAGHSSSDDPSVYRDPAEPKQWEAKDPLERWRRHLEQRGLWSQAVHDRYAQEITDELTAAVKHAGAVGSPPVESLFDDVFAELPPHLKEQKAELLALPRSKSGHERK
jgi:2-oxoisovalerate dehydrogenase E1 component alpha subunit